MILLLSLLTVLNFHSQKAAVKNAWLRPAAKGMNSALYFDITNNSGKADTLFGVSSNLANVIQIHESYMKNGMMGMREVKYVVVKPHSTFSFKEGGYHVMLILLKRNLKPGSTEIFFLHFKNRKDFKINALVKKN